MAADSIKNRWRGARAKSAQRKMYWAGAAAGFGATIYRNWDVIRPVGAGIAGGVAGFAKGLGRGLVGVVVKSLISC